MVNCFKILKIIPLQIKNVARHCHLINNAILKKKKKICVQVYPLFLPPVNL